MTQQIQTHIQVDYQNRDRATSFFRPLLVLPVAFFLMMFNQLSHWGFSTVALTLPVVVSLLFRQSYPSWILSFNHAILEFGTRAAAYALLLTDKYPTYEGNPTVAVIFPDVENGKKLNRWLPIIKWILAIPLYLVGTIYLVLTTFVTIGAWFAILFTGNFPTWAANVSIGTMRFWNRVYGYAIVLTTDEYPSFSLNK